MFGLFEGDKAPALEEHKAPPPVIASGGGTEHAAEPASSTAAATGFDLFHPITSMKSVLEHAGSAVGAAVTNAFTPAPAAGVKPPDEAPPAPPKSSPEMIKAAEASREQLHANMDKLGDLSAEQKKSILDRTKGLSGDALVTEMHALENALKGKNGDRALATYAELNDMMAKNPEAKSRLTPDMMSTLVTGVANSRTDSDRGQAGILGAKQARDSAQALIDMSPEEFAKTQKLLDQAGKDSSGKLAPGADPAAEQALILKAVAARKDEYHHTFFGDVANGVEKFFGVESANAKANKDIDQFAKDIRGMGREDLIRNTTLIDIDDKNTSTTDPDSNKKKDDKVDNDGLFQRFTTTCGPTTAQMVKGENDPVYALKLRQNNFNDPDPNSEFAQEQKKVLEDNGGTAVSRLGENARKDAAKKVAELKKSGDLNQEQYDGIKNTFLGKKMEGEEAKKAQAAIDDLRKKNDGHPTDAEIAEIQKNAGKTAAGMVLDPALNTIAGKSAHVDFEDKDMGSGMNAENMKNVDGLLKDGQQVPIRIAGTGNDGHFMMVSDTRGAPGNRQYLVSDPWSGATRWVPEADFKSGAFTTKQFDLGTAQVTDFYADKKQTI